MGVKIKTGALSRPRRVSIAPELTVLAEALLEQSQS